MSKEIRFACVKVCSSLCCGGATILTIKEITTFYKNFPITIGFRKIYPIDSFHKSYIEDFAIKYENFYIIGDFIGGNRLKKRCHYLKETVCSIHNTKPLQCSIIPFSVTFPEEYQNLVISERRKKAFHLCKGFTEDAPVVWNKVFIDKTLREIFYTQRQNMIFQKEFMEKAFCILKDTPLFKRFIISTSGIIEIPILPEFLEEFFLLASINNQKEFIESQKRLFVKELTVGGLKNSLFVDALEMINKAKYLTEFRKS
ncbi:MAG: YkgJ family cysteine cluster protein [Thermodesulfovibrio sp.]|nr:YkgJ family cysteine cluster protein [Thermodesulfovibrio sp.]